MERRASAALAPIHDEIHAMVQASAVKYTDATTWTRRGKPLSVTVLATKTLSAFFITKDGSRDTIEPLFDVDVGMLVSDRASIFSFWSMYLRQICWSHLIRKFVYFSEREGLARKYGRDLLALAALVFDYWHAFLDGKFEREELCRWMKPLRSAFRETLDRAVAADIER
ncbi:MAG: transposase, partial [Nannocystaceae bacterium]